MLQRFRKLLSDTKGATAIEYGLVASLIAIAAVAAMQNLGNELQTSFSTVQGKMGDANASMQERVGA